MTEKGMDYLEFGPASGGPARRLVVLVHGYGVHAGYMKTLARDIMKEMPDALVVCPQAPHAMNLPKQGDAPPFPTPEEALNPRRGMPRSLQREWFSIALAPAQIHQKLLETAQAVNGFVDELRDRLGIQDKDVAMMGFSQGGAVAMYSAFTRGRDVGCVVAHSSLIIHTKDFKNKPPTLLVYGGEDKSFSQDRYRDHAIEPLEDYLSDFTAKKFEKLGHDTSAESRRATVDYIRKKLQP
jgi:phospholipase/carboxylesterase